MAACSLRSSDLGGNDGASAVAIQPDGKILVAGFTDPRPTDAHDSEDFALVRYTTGGKLDKSFGSGGKVVTDLGGGAGASAVAIQPNGKIVAAGSAAHDFALVRYTK